MLYIIEYEDFFLSSFFLLPRIIQSRILIISCHNTSLVGDILRELINCLSNFHIYTRALLYDKHIGQ